MKSFATIVQDVHSLSLDKMDELDTLLEKFKIEKRREEIVKNHNQALKDNEEGKLKSYNTVNAINYLRDL